MQNRWVLSAWLVGALMACGSVKTGAGPDGGGPGPDDGTLDFVSGTRLRARLLDGGDGARSFVGWFDRERSENCSFYRTEDDQVRCLPEAGGVVYLDAACARPVVVRGCQQATGLAIRYLPRDGDDCAQQPKVAAYEIGGELAAADIPAEVFVLNDATGECYPNGPPYGTLHAIGESVPPDGFVAAHVESEPRDGGLLGVRVQVGDDGSRQALGLYDVARDELCDPRDGRCIPIESASYLIDDQVPVFADTACTARAAYRPSRGPGCEISTIVHEYVAPSPDGCGYELAYHVAGEKVVTPHGGTSDGATCGPLAPDQNEYFALGAPIAETTFQPYARVTVGEGAVGVLIDSTEGGDPLYALPYVLVDRERGVNCFAQPFVDGSIHCVPENSGFSTVGDVEYFADAECTQRIAVTYPAACGQAEPTIALRGRVAPCGGYVVETAHSIIGEHPRGLAYFHREAGGDECLPGLKELTEPYGVLSEPLEPEALPLLTARTE